jgi:hypothetical protein
MSAVEGQVEVRRTGITGDSAGAGRHRMMVGPTASSGADPKGVALAIGILRRAIAKGVVRVALAGASGQCLRRHLRPFTIIATTIIATTIAPTIAPTNATTNRLAEAFRLVRTGEEHRCGVRLRRGAGRHWGRLRNCLTNSRKRAGGFSSGTELDRWRRWRPAPGTATSRYRAGCCC